LGRCQLDLAFRYSRCVTSKPVAVVIGVGPKNGASFARRFAEEGYAVALLSRSTQLSESLASELGDAKAYACDVGDPDAVAAAFAKIRAELGTVDTLIYNAGAGSWGTIEEIDAAGFERGWRINTMGLFLASKQVIDPMIEAGQGNIIVVGATASLRGKPFTTGFAPAKAGQRSLAQAMARHLGPKGLHVSLLIIDGGIGEAGAEPPAEGPKKLDPEHIAHAAAFLAKQPRSAWTFELDLRPMHETW
jgi:NAD(P)-dependent dehydrogenase (short-subunit alcohol dehydrogenase family)